MKYLLVLADGMADYDIPELGNKTVLEYAHTPNMDFLAQTALIGKAQTIPDGYHPGSDVANLSVLGYDPKLYYTGRSPLEAASMGVKLEDNDLALRCNLVTLSDQEQYSAKTMVDYSSGEISSADSSILIKTLQEELGNNEITFFPGLSYRHLVVWKNAKDKELLLTPPHDISQKPIREYLPAGSDSTFIQDLMLKSNEILAEHWVNEKRRANGEMPATSAWLWGEGKKPALASFEQLFGLKGAVVAAVDLVKGLGVSAGMEIIEVPGATGSIKTNFSAKAKAAVNALKKDIDFVYLHIESADESGHQGSLNDKIWSIEQIDSKVISLIIDELKNFDNIRIMILPDHPTPLSTKTHSKDPVPYMIFDKNNPFENSIGIYNEKSTDNGLFFSEGHKLMEFFIKGKHFQ